MNSADVLKHVLMRWLAAINGHDVTALAALMAADFVFVDSVGNRVDGAKSMAAGWSGYFAMCPDYWILTDQVMAEAAWKAVIRNHSVAEWRVFADNKPVYEILKKRQRRGHS
jgi:SnoaL-like domain